MTGGEVRDSVMSRGTKHLNRDIWNLDGEGESWK